MQEQEMNKTAAEPIVECDGLVKIYKTKDIEVLALQGLDLTINKGELMAIIGNSGSGKSTFLNMIGGLDKPSAGKLIVDGKDLFKLGEKELVEYKRNTVGFVWQNNARNLMPYLTALQNVQMPMLFGNVEEKKVRALRLLELVGMDHKKDSKLNQLSGGEQQRIAIAIAIANDPKILLADEPTGSVDVNTGNYILDVFKKLNEELGITIIIVTHDRLLSKKVNRVVSIRDGKTSSERIMKKSYSEQMKELGALGAEILSEETQEEYAVLDKAGRLQIPREILEEAGIKGNKLLIEVKDNIITLRQPDEDV